MPQFYKQVKAVRRFKGGLDVHTGWVPEEFAKVGKVLKFKMEDGEWDDGFEVVEVGERKEESLVLEDSQDWKHQHKASDKLTPNTGLFKKG